MELNLLNQLGEGNPQLFRELKGRLKRRNIIVTGVSSFLVQLLLLFFNSSESGNSDWQIQWLTLFKILNWMLPLLLLFGGVHTISSDVIKEEHRGTLNFIRLSPTSGQSILLGKILGVPLLLYLGVALAVPLHLISAIAGGLPLGWIIGFYLLWGASCGVFYSTALLLTFLGASQEESKSIPGVSSLLAGILGLILITTANLVFERIERGDGLGDGHWFFLLIGAQPIFAYALTLLTLSVATYWTWQAVNRRFRNPNTTLLSKTQSYWLVASCQLWMIGFVLPNGDLASAEGGLFVGLFLLFLVNPIGYLILIAALSPGRQAIQDWTRYHKIQTQNERLNQQASSKFNFSGGILSSPLAQNLIWGEKSPALVAVAVNLLMTTGFWGLWILLWSQQAWPQGFNALQALLGWLLSVNVILIFAAIVELKVFFVKVYQQALWASGTLAAIFLLPCLLVYLSLTPEKAPALWFFSALPVIAVQYASATTIFLGFLGQLSILSLLSLQIAYQLRKTGESTAKNLLTGSPTLPGNRLKSTFRGK